MLIFHGSKNTNKVSFLFEHLKHKHFDFLSKQKKTAARYISATELVKSRMAMQQQGAENLSVFQVLWDMYDEEGFGFPFFGGLWKGVENDLSQGIVNAALMMMVKEQLYHVVRKIVLGKGRK